jgi:protein O-GlcNAc transferase
MVHKKKKKRKQKLSSSKSRLIQGRNSSNRSPFDISAQLRKAFQYVQSGQLQEAQQICEKVLHKAFQCLQSGQLQEAETIYREVLRIVPNHSESLYLLGITSHQLGNSDSAVSLIKKAILNDPVNSAYHKDLGNIFLDQGKSDEAISCYRKALELKPNEARTYNDIGDAFAYQGKFNDAISYYQKALELEPGFAEAYRKMGNAFQGQSKLNEAIVCYQKVLEFAPDDAKAHNNMGVAFQNQGKLSEAISCYQQALQLKPHYAKAYNNIGNVLRDQSNWNEAISYYHKASELEPDDVEVYNNMGVAFQNQGKLAEAISCYQQALQLKPHYAKAYNNIGTVLQVQGNLDEAISYYQKALELKPDDAEVYKNIGIVWQDLGKSDEAIACYQKAVELELDSPEVYSLLVFQLQQTCAWQKLEFPAAKLNSFTKTAIHNGTKTPELPFDSLSRHADLSLNLAIAKSWSSDIARHMSNLKTHFSFNVRNSSKTRIAVGYLSTNFRDHATAHLMLSLFGLHNRHEFEVFCYSYGKDDGSYYRKRIQQDCDKFVDLQDLGHSDAARCIYEDGVDILVDLMGHTRGSRLEICALRPAPIQVRYLGLAGTTGADFFDYIITDRVVTPGNYAPYYSEKFCYMPHCYQVNDHTQPMSEKEWKKTAFGLPEGSFVFCSFSTAYKIESVMFDVWMRILKKAPESVLWLLLRNKTGEDNLRTEAENRGVKSERLIFGDNLPKDEHLARMRLANLALDTRVVNGAATTSDALCAGVPVITLQGTHFASRMSSSILTAIGLPEMITHTLEEYESLAVWLLRNPYELQAIRQKLARNRLTEPLFDTPRFAKNLEKAYREMWQIFLAGEQPRRIDVVEN